MQMIPWRAEQPPQAQILEARLQAPGLEGYTWSNGPLYHYAAHRHTYEKVLYCLHGSITFTLPEQQDARGCPLSVTLRPGDCLILPAHTLHRAEVGPQGVRCLEAARSPR